MTPRDMNLHLPVCGLTLRGLQWEGTGTPILALHGWLDNAASFATLAPELVGRPVVALDFPGHGHSDHIPPGGLYHFIDGVFVIHEIISALGWPSYILLGHSMGGATASLYATYARESLRALILIEGLGPLAAPATETHARFIKHLDMRAMLGTKELPRYRSIDDAVRARTIATGIQGAVIRSVVERGLKDWEGGFTWRSDPRLTIPSPTRLTEDQIENLFGNLRVPTLHVTATKGIVTDKGPFPTPHREAWVQNLTAAQLEGGHHVHLERPREVAALMREFLTANKL